MRKIAFLLACLSSGSHGQRVQTSGRQARGRHSAEGSSLELIQPGGHVLVQQEVGSVRALAALLQALGPAAAFSLCGLHPHASICSQGHAGSHRQGHLGHQAPVMGILEDAGKGLLKGAKENYDKLEKARVDALVKQGILAPIEYDDYIAPNREMPTSLVDSFVALADGCRAAIADGKTKLLVEHYQDATDETYSLMKKTMTVLEPLLPVILEAVAPLEPGIAADATTDATGAPLPPRLKLFVPDMGTAIYIQEKWNLPSRVEVASYNFAEITPGTQAVMLTCPMANDVDLLQQIIRLIDANFPDMISVMINPELINFGTTAKGNVGREVEAFFDEIFENVFSFSFYAGVPIPGALYHVYPGPWTVWRTNPDGKGYNTAYSSKRRPGKTELVYTHLTPPPPPGEEGSGGFFGRLGSFVKNFQSM